MFATTSLNMQSVLVQLAVMAVLTATISATNKKYLESCTNTDDCVDPFLCLASVCDCTLNQTISSDRKLCLPGISYMEPCRETGQCLLMLVNTFCGRSNKCECADGYGYDTTNRSCSTIIDNAVAHGGKCHLDRQCKQGMVCEGDICECRTGLHWDRTSQSCLVDLVPGTCSTNNDCVQYSYTECRNGNCVCRSGYKNIPGGFACQTATGAGLRSVVYVILLSLLFNKVTS